MNTYIHFKECISEILDLQRQHHEIIKETRNPTIKQVSLAELHRLNLTLANYLDVLPDIIGVIIKMLPFQRHHRIKIVRNQRQSVKFSFDILKDKPFWIWDKQEHLTRFKQSNGNCCFNHIVGLPQKDGREYPLFDYEKLLYDNLIAVRLRISR